MAKRIKILTNDRKWRIEIKGLAGRIPEITHASDRLMRCPREYKVVGHDLKTIVSNDNKARFSHFRDGNFFYVVEVQGQRYSFPIPIEDAKGTTLFAEFKAITLMRWIRKAIEARTFQLAR
jgi:hypothetical protein